LTTGWTLNASYEHYWTPQFHESFIGGYVAVRYNSQANNLLCEFEGDGFATVPGFGGTGSLALAPPTYGGVATRLQYDFTKTLYLGVEVM
jgi:hypothetical protein